MKAPSKILIAYDGSACSDAALQDLRRAGLPPDADVVVLTVADVIVPPPDEELPGQPAVRIPEFERHTRETREKAVKEARALAERAAGLVKDEFPSWRVKAEVDCDSPPLALIKMADRLQADLIVVGSHRHAVAGGRLILGSTSQRVLYDAGCSVRVARCSSGRREGPVRIIVGFSGTPDAEEAVAAVAARAWPEGSEARIVTAGRGPGRDSTSGAAERLRATGLSVSEFVREGDPAHVLIAEAEGWDADSIFVGTRGLHGFQHLLHGSVASAVAGRAQCSVEVARAARLAAPDESKGEYTHAG
ncbi:MAG TPA: universal stress protein [Pyrinomonadaceae bacterium]|nr:universal stress protein [Pyrinomonadaceae bacterium]